jgi:single-strand DNA-binding protein
MASVNKVILVGHLGREPEVKEVQGFKIASFTLATSRKTKQAEETEWHNLKCFNRLAEIAEQYLKKGSLVYIEGRLTTRTWEKDGQKHSRTEIVVESLQMLGGKPNNQAQTAAPQRAAAPQQQAAAPDDWGNTADDIPF